MVTENEEAAKIGIKVRLCSHALITVGPC